MLDTTDKLFLTNLRQYLDKRLERLLDAILSQDLSEKAVNLERNSTKGMKRKIDSLLEFVDKVENHVESGGFFNRKLVDLLIENNFKAKKKKT